MGNLWNRTLTFDAKTMRFEDWNGHLRVKKTNLTKANICEYYGFEIKNHMKYGLEPERKYRFLRSPDALKKAVFSFKERPILYVHKAAERISLIIQKSLERRVQTRLFLILIFRLQLRFGTGIIYRQLKTIHRLNYLLLTLLHL